MVRAEIDLKAVTPAFIHAEDGGTAEFRVPSLRGVLRYWTRALWGAHEQNPEALFKEESKLWGRTDQPSRVRIWSKTVPPISRTTSFLLPHYPGNQGRPSSALMPGTSLTVLVDSRERSSLETAVRILRIALSLGGLGQRSRRGAGSFEVTAVRGIEDESLCKPTPRNQQSFAQWIKSMILCVQGNNASIAPHRSHHFPILCSQESCSIIRVRERDKADSEGYVRAEIMRGLRNCKSPAWGLPYLKPKLGEQPIGGRNVRWASPVHFRVLPAEKGFLEVLTVMKSSFPTHIPAPRQSWAEIDRFVSNFGGCKAWP